MQVIEKIVHFNVDDILLLRANFLQVQSVLFAYIESGTEIHVLASLDLDIGQRVVIVCKRGVRKQHEHPLLVSHEQERHTHT